MGAPVASENGYAPLRLYPQGILSVPPRLKAIQYQLPVASAQVKSCLLLAALAADGMTTLVEPGPSRDHTERLLHEMGLSIHWECVNTGPGESRRIFITRITPSYRLQLPPLHMEIPGDFSAAAFLIVAALVTPGSEVVIRNVGLNPTRTGLLDVLHSMGANIQIDALSKRHGEPIGDLTVYSSELFGVEISGELVVRMIDEFPIFAVAAACAKGLSRVRDAQELRLKESDRITALCRELRVLGIHADEAEDGFYIYGGGGISGGVVNSAGDHRLAMAFAVAGLVAQKEVVVLDAEYIAESYPQFVESLMQLGASLVVRE
jgi:3-phosphoshikimate 1-carboxyvinyltransferase